MKGLPKTSDSLSTIAPIKEHMQKGGNNILSRYTLPVLWNEISSWLFYSHDYSEQLVLFNHSVCLPVYPPLTVLSPVVQFYSNNTKGLNPSGCEERDSDSFIKGTMDFAFQTPEKSTQGRDIRDIQTAGEKIFKFTYIQGKFKHKIQIYRKQGCVNTAVYGKYWL